MLKCYYCGRPSEGSEHVPPKCIFPKLGDVPDGKEYRKNLITVPSCKKHNTEKSGDDQFLWYVLACNLPVNEIAGHLVETRLIRTIERRPALMRSFIQTAKPVMLRDERTNEFFESGAVTIDPNRLDSVLTHVAKGIYFHHYKGRWKGSLRVIPHFLSYLDGDKAVEANRTLEVLYKAQEALFSNAEFHGENPDVFSYQLVVPENEKQVKVAARLNFYGGCKVTVLYGTSAANHSFKADVPDGPPP